MTRRKHLGNLGERWTQNLLEGAGFGNVQDLNAIRYNHPGGDFVAKRKGKPYFITVKVRNKYVRGSRRLNGGYNIYPDKVRAAAKEYKAIPSWITIQLDTEKRCYSAYFGTIAALLNPNSVAVPMSPRATSRYECLANEQFDPAITGDLSNQLSDGTKRHISNFVRNQTDVGRSSDLRNVRKRPRISSIDALKPATTPKVSFEDHVAYVDPPIRPVLREIRTRITALDRCGAIKEQATKHQRVAYSVARIFAEVKVQKKRILIRFFGTSVPDPNNLVTNIPATHRWQHDKEIAIDRFDLVDYAMTFIEASHRSHQANKPSR